jgi:hypothetical protein
MSINDAPAITPSSRYTFQRLVLGLYAPGVEVVFHITGYCTDAVRHAADNTRSANQVNVTSSSRWYGTH